MTLDSKFYCELRVLLDWHPRTRFFLCLPFFETKASISFHLIMLPTASLGFFVLHCQDSGSRHI